LKIKIIKFKMKNNTHTLIRTTIVNTSGHRGIS
jgi:hypothetical protein